MDEPFIVISSKKSYVKRFRLYGQKTVFRFNPPPSGTTEIEWLQRGFKHIVDEIKTDASVEDKIGFTISSLNFKNKEPGYVAFRSVKELTDDTLWDVFGSIVQSNRESMTSSETFKIESTRVNLPVGDGRSRVRPGMYNSFSEECHARQGIVCIKNNDNLCLPRALVVAKAYAKKNPLLKAIRENYAQRQTIRARKLMAKARVEIPENGAGIPELEKFQDYLNKYKITVYNYNTKGREVYFTGNNNNAVFKLNLLFHQGHYNVITSLTAAFVCKFYCEACHTPYDHRSEHRCSNMCPACKTVSPPCTIENNGVSCPRCNRVFRNQTCFIAHQGDVCNSIKLCKLCDKIVLIKKRTSDHQCGEIYCKTCAGFKSSEHMCYMRVDSRKPPISGFMFIFFDFETRQDQTIHPEDNTKVHIVNLCVSKQYCWKCLDGEECAECTPRTRVFKSDPITHFMNYVMNVRKTVKQLCLIAHNGQGFDFQFILKYILEQTKFTPKLITRGTKIILMELDNVKFIDSLSYFPMALSKLPKAFDLPPEKKKGFFPHLFNIEENQNYSGHMPAKHYYCPDSMFEDTNEEFNKWYDDQVCTNYVFDFKKELMEYCISDVDILSQACLKFRTMFLTECSVDPFMEGVTIAGACNLAFRRSFLKPNTIGLIPPQGYRLADKQSTVALQWLSLEEKERNIHIRHAGREREVKINGMRVDGFDGSRIYEFQGCYFHGCPKCYPYKREEFLKEDPSDSLHLRYERTKAKMAKLSETSYEVVEMWECEFNNIKRNDSLSYLNSLPILNKLPLNPRNAFYGGRTGNTKIYHQCLEDETIQYVDVCSLYPYVCKYGKYPIGHPTIHIGNDECSMLGMDVEGLLKCKILPPEELYHPVLPVKMHNKLMFVLCRTCAEETWTHDCDHTIEERALSGTWTMDEIRVAIDKGYKIMEMYEIWEYQTVTFEKGGLFTEFINKFLKIKQEASGYPLWCITEEDKNNYIRKYMVHEGIQLDHNKIMKNEGLRSLAKLILNSFWGKFGQRENLTKTLITRQPGEFFKLMTNPRVQVNTVHEINEEVLLLNWQHLEEAADTLRTANVVIAAYTTAQARLKLYEHLNALERQVLYYDTDSVFYIHKEGAHRVLTGDFLGQMTDELTKNYGLGSYISGFVSAGPKTYAYIVQRSNSEERKHVCKVKGLTLNLKTSEKINFNKLKEMVLSGTEYEEVLQDRIKTTRNKDVVTVTESKIFKVTGAKRKQDSEFDTVPYGYKHQKCVE